MRPRRRRAVPGGRPPRADTDRDGRGWPGGGIGESKLGHFGQGQLSVLVRILLFHLGQKRMNIGSQHKQMFSWLFNMYLEVLFSKYTQYGLCGTNVP